MNDLVTINRPIKDVFEFVANHANDKLWKPFVTTSKQTSTGHIGVGTRFEVGMVTWNHYLASTVEIVEYEPYRWYVYKSCTPPFHFVAHLSFASVALGTELRGYVEFQARGLWKLLKPLIKTFFKSQEKHTFSKLKKILENQSTL